MFREFFGMLVWLVIGKRNHDMPDSLVQLKPAPTGSLGDGCKYVAVEEDHVFWDDQNKMAIWRPSQNTAVLVSLSNALIEEVDDDCETLEDAQSALDWWLNRQ